ncbi:Pre-mRNA-splicing factor SPF27 [Xylaria palmicola]|nr:Pre-mRNA-splicing factor SPF27 [Xylaria palmicola]
MASSIRTTVHESLPYIDQEPTPSERIAAESLIAAELSSSSSSSASSPESSSSSALPPLPPPNFTPLMAAELSRVASGAALDGIDATRYEIQDSPSSSSPSDLAPLLSRAYATHTYLRHRQAHLRLLDAYGKNAWLVANWHAEAGDLAALERDLAAARRDVDVVNLERRRRQDDVGEELRALGDAWRRGVGRVLETEVATEALRRQVLEKQRGGA